MVIIPTVALVILASPIIFIVIMGVSPEVFGFYVMIMPSLFVLATFISRKMLDYITVDQIVIIGGFFSCSGGVLQLFSAHLLFLHARGRFWSLGSDFWSSGQHFVPGTFLESKRFRELLCEVLREPGIGHIAAGNASRADGRLRESLRELVAVVVTVSFT